MLNIITKYGKILGIVLFVIIVFSLDWRKTIGIISRIDLKFLFSAVMLFPLFVFLKALRWNILLKGQGLDYPLTSCFTVYLSSNFLGVLTPSRVGEISKILYLKQDRDLSFSRGLSSVLADRFFDLSILSFVAFIAFFVIFETYRLFTASVILISIAGIIIFWINSKRLDNFIKGFLYRKKRRRLYRRIRIFCLSLLSFRLNTIGYSFILSFSGIMLFFLICHLLALSLHLKPDLFFIPFSVSIANFAAILPISVSGIGIRDFVLILVFGKAGFPPETALSFSILFLFYFTGLWTLTGWIAWNIKPISIPKEQLKEEIT
ncbi:MAG: lysylphosphatidylglycerol synthase transmembrane domain-containing protein [Nitrospirota bacterium]